MPPPSSHLSSHASVLRPTPQLHLQVIHKDRRVMCNMPSYRKRMWCRAEQLSHFLRNGRDSMWVATSESGLLEDSAVDSALDEEGAEREDRAEGRDSIDSAALNEANVRVGKMATWEGGSGESWHHEFLRVFGGLARPPHAPCQPHHTASRDSPLTNPADSSTRPSRPTRFRSSSRCLASMVSLPHAPHAHVVLSSAPHLAAVLLTPGCPSRAPGELLSSAGGDLSPAHLARIEEVPCDTRTR